MTSTTAINPFILSPSVIEYFSGSSPQAITASSLAGVQGGMFVGHLLSAEEAALLLREIDSADLVPTAVNGMRANFREGDPVGSLRATADSAALADLLYRRLRSVTPLQADSDDPTDTDGRTWDAVGVNPRMRFIRYRPGGYLVPHYDAPYTNSEGIRTLLTIVIYLDEECAGGETRFIADPQRNVPFGRRDFSDWTRPATAEEVLHSQRPAIGSALAFWHRTLHDSALLVSGVKTIIRTDVLYRPTASPL